MTLVNGVYKISNSEVQTFKHCRRRWWLSWYRGLTPRRQTVNSPASTGGRIHEALAAYYVPDGEVPGDPLTVLAAAQKRDMDIILTRRLEEFGEDEERRSNEEESELTRAFDLERAMIQGYLEWLTDTGVDSDLEVIDSEKYVEAALHETPGVLLIGKIDARTVSHQTGRRRFIDHKTVGSFIIPTLSLNEQMLHYHLIEWLNTAEGEERCDGALYNMLRKVKRTRASKPPYYERRPVDHNIHELLSYQARLTGTVEVMLDVTARLDAGEDPKTVVYPTPGRDCSWICPFFRVCRMFDDNSRVEAALENLYEERNPLDYYGGREKSGGDE